MKLDEIRVGEHYCVDLPREESLRYGQFRMRALVVATGLPHGKTNLGVMVEFPHRVPRWLPPSVGAGWETDLVTGEVIYDERTAVVVLHPARVIRQWDEYELGVAIMRHEHEQWNSLRT